MHYSTFFTQKFLCVAVAFSSASVYANNEEVGAFLSKIMEKGGTEDWRKVLRDATGEDLSTRAMVEYFKPLMAWLEKENKGRQIGWE
jgi:peptidyl-dipeptidase A